MPSNNKPGRGPYKKGRRQYRISVRAVQRQAPDIRKLARAAIELAMAQAEAEAEAQDKTASNTSEIPLEKNGEADD